METIIALPDMILDGKGDISIPGVKIPLQEGDMLRDPNADYDLRSKGVDYYVIGNVLRTWIRRAVHAEAFALAMEAEVERLREQIKIIGSRT